MSWKNTNQPTLGLADTMMLERGKAIKKFDPIHSLMDWDAIEKHLGDIHDKRRGSPAYPPLKMLKAFLLQAWHGLGDPEMESLLETHLAFRRFTGFTLDMKTPDHSTIWKFRQQLQQSGALRKILNEVKTQLEQKGAMVKKGKVAVVDVAVIGAARARKKKNRNGDNTQDPEAGYSVKGGHKRKSYVTYGYKLHTKTDQEGMIRKVICTPGNTHDSKMLPN